MKVDVSPGAIVINHLQVVVDTDEFKAVEGDLASKYPGPITYSWSGASHGVIIWADEERTLYTDITRELLPTEIHFDLDDGGWIVMAHAAKYSLYIAMYRQKDITDPNAVIYQLEK